MAQLQLGTIDYLQHQEVSDLCACGRALATNTCSDGIAPADKQADHLLETRRHVPMLLHENERRDERCIQVHSPLVGGVQYLGDLEFDEVLVMRVFAQQKT
ncbi:hypothetical protein PFLmoz3_04443 [Pseudomonas fluorescens]|uniref:Uncharacterized protein n=1 Tax=Pseudomonas fluorescens TaxID=294 RepID=A0A109LEL8_PSEFL|nr:hypothetical protein PFLmoz3_04443 [Pseudomonas fluorescens]